ncbi:RNA polymerase sigma factor [Lentzea sp. NPDC102401]|uniref:RNA polymerase sigma factor n=1 Tax=Lentzea sp. NPDC102401 TaxID=3364128 RepID=UPI00381E20B8
MTPDEPSASPAAVRMGQLLEAARHGSRDSLNEIVRELSPMMWHVARAQGLDRDAASDVVQNAWLKLIVSWSDIRSPQALISWLVTVTKRESWRARRARGQEDLVDGSAFEMIVDDLPTPEEHVVTDASQQHLWALVRQLPSRCQALLRMLAFTHRPDYGEIGATLGMKHGTIGPTRGRCLAKLRTLLTSDASTGGSRGRE